MKSQRIHTDYLKDMLDACLKITQFTNGISFDEFLQDEKTQYAVIRALEIIGEAAKKIPQPIKDQVPDIPWRAIAGMRDKVIHDYMGINQAVVWKTVVEDIPLLSNQLTKYINTL